MRHPRNDRPRFAKPMAWMALALAGLLALPLQARAGKLSWLDDVVQEVIVEARASGKAAAGQADSAARSGVRSTTRLFAGEGDDALEALAKRHESLARLGGKVDDVSEAVLESRFSRMVKPDPDMARTFRSLAPAEKKLVVEMGEAAGRLASRYPGQAETLVRKLGTEGLSAVRVYGDDVAEVLAEEGPQAIGILKKTGRNGWDFFTSKVLPNKKKLAAAGVLTLFLADPDKFVDTAGQFTQYAAEQFAKAGIQLVSSVGSGAMKGLESSIGTVLEGYGLNFGLVRYAGMAGAMAVIAAALLVILGLPVRLMFSPFRLALKVFRR